MTTDHTYNVTDGVIRWGRSSITGVEASTFQVLNDTWARDERRVYSCGRPLRRADVETFEVLNDIYVKDRNLVFYLSGIIKEANAATFRALDPGHFESYWSSPGMPCLNRQGFACDDRFVFHYVQTIGKPCVVQGADLASFEVLQFNFARDALHVFHERRRLPHAKPAAFRVLNHFFGTDDARIYYLDRPVPDADVRSFSIIQGMLARDDNHVFQQDSVIPGADPATFQLLGTDIVTRDATTIFVHGVPLLDADASTFEMLGGAYHRDARAVYFYGTAIPGADLLSFRVHDDSEEAEDANHKYRNGIPIRVQHR